MEEYDFLGKGKKEFSLHERLFRVLFSSNHGFYPISASVNLNGIVRLSYEISNLSHSIDKEPFFDLNPQSKIIDFYKSPKSRIIQREVSELVDDLKKQGYKINGEDFLARKFKENEISLF